MEPKSAGSGRGHFFLAAHISSNPFGATSEKSITTNDHHPPPLSLLTHTGPTGPTHTANMSDGEVEVEAPQGYPVLPKDVTQEIGSIKLFNKWSYEDVEIRDISLTYVALISAAAGMDRRWQLLAAGIGTSRMANLCAQRLHPDPPTSLRLSLRRSLCRQALP